MIMPQNLLGLKFVEKTIHQNCLEFLMIEGCKYLNDQSPQIMNGISRLEKITRI